jgi:ABC-type phosphate transport system substrate-binding protein
MSCFRHRGSRFVLGLGASSLLLAVSVAGHPAGATDASTTLFAEGGSFELNLIAQLQADGNSAIAPLVPAYFNANIDLARQDFASGVADYAVSELPLTSADAATAAQNKRTFAYVPFAASPVAIAAVVECGNDQTLKPTTLCPNLQLTVPLLAKIFTHGIPQWNDPSLSQFSGGKPAPVSDASKSVSPLDQIDPSASNLALASAFVNDPTAKITWDAFLKSNKITDDTPSDLWPTGQGSTGGDRTLADALVPVNETTLVPQSNPSLWGEGEVAPLPGDWLGAPRNFSTNGMTIAIQNASGKYVTPTSTSTLAALNDSTMDPSTNLVTFNSSSSDAAAYPIDVMSYLIVPTSGLSAAKATALAAFIRFVLGQNGQADIKSFGDAPVAAASSQAMLNAGMHVADLVAAEATQTTTTTSTTTVPGTTVSTDSPTSSSNGNGGSGNPTLTSGSSPSLAFTGGVPLPVLAGGAGLVAVSIVFRRRLKRRIAMRGSDP